MKKLLLNVVLFIACCSLAYTQKISKVTSIKDASPLAGVSDVVKDGKLATPTNVRGNFSISVPSNGRIIFSFYRVQNN